MVSFVSHLLAFWFVVMLHLWCGDFNWFRWLVLIVAQVCLLGFWYAGARVGLLFDGVLFG